MTTKITSDNISSLSNLGVTWNAVTVADGSTQLSASAGNAYFLDTNTGVIEVLLPSSPSRGDTVILADYSGTFATNKAIVNTGGKLIDSTEGGPGTSNDFELTTNNQVVELVFVDNDKGWLVKTNSTPSGISAIAGGGGYGASFIEATGGTVSTSGDFKIHTFTGDGCFVVAGVSNTAANNEVSYIVVGGGGGSGSNAGGGGGAGGFRESKSGVDSYTASPKEGATNITVTATTFPITVGGGGAGSTAGPAKGANGSNSVFSTVTSSGGGGGGAPGSNAGGPGASGGGARSNCDAAGGTGNTPPVSPSQGSNGGASGPPSSPPFLGGGGGGATAAGASGNPGNGGGGAGATTNITGSPVAYAGGGGGGSNACATSGGPAGTGGGGAGGNNPAAGTTGSANTGGGAGGSGGAASPNNGVAGGKGVVIIRYKSQ